MSRVWPASQSPSPLWLAAWFFMLLAVCIAFVLWRVAYGCMDLLADAWAWWDSACDQPFISEEDGDAD